MPIKQRWYGILLLVGLGLNTITSFRSNDTQPFLPAANRQGRSQAPNRLLRTYGTIQIIFFGGNFYAVGLDSDFNNHLPILNPSGFFLFAPAKLIRDNLSEAVTTKKERSKLLYLLHGFFLV